MRPKPLGTLGPSLALLMLVLPVACGGSSSSSSSTSGGTTQAPSITSFIAVSGRIPSGATALLEGTFHNGTGVISPGNIPMTSGTPVPVSPAATTTYTLTVTSSGTTPVTQTATVTFLPSPNLIGTWLFPGETGPTLITFLDDSNYLFAEQGPAAKGGQSGLEVGTYTWASATGDFTANVTRCDTLGDWGLVGSPSSTTSCTVGVSNNVMTFTFPGAVTRTATRLTASPQTLQGSWGWQDTNGTYVLAILDASNWLFAEQGSPQASPGGQNGIQVGTYTWNGATGAWTDLITTNTMGTWGLADPPPATMAATGQTLLWTSPSNNSVAFPLIGNE